MYALEARPGYGNTNCMFNEFTQLRNSILRVAAAFFLFATVMFIIPVYQGASFAVLALERLRADLVPEGVALIITNPIDAFLTQFIVAGVLAFLALAPFIALEAWRYVAPALYGNERRGFAWFLLLSIVLWYVGALFAYLVIIPVTYGALYGFLPQGVLPYFSLRELVGLTAGLTLVSGLIFLLPVAMALLTKIGLVSSGFWRSHARHAILIALVVSAIITPDGSGVSMILLTLPIGALYAAGYAGASALSRGKNKELGSKNYAKNLNS